MTDKVTENVTLGSKMDVPYDGVSPAITSVAGDSIWIYLFSGLVCPSEMFVMAEYRKRVD